VSPVLRAKKPLTIRKFGRDLGKWGRKIKAPPDADQVKLFILVSNVEQGLAALEFGADVIIAQGKRFAQIMPHLQERTGSEAGGHGSSKGMPLLTFLPLLISALPPSHPPVLAAGGIATGAHIAAARCLGADGVVMGTRFLACPESGYSEPQKQAILDGKGSCTVRSVLFDQLTDMMDWPDDIDGRSLINQTFIESLEGKRSMAELKADYAKALEGKDTSRIVVWAGMPLLLAL
jgi:nitronate monooxygenase